MRARQSFITRAPAPSLHGGANEWPRGSGASQLASEGWLGRRNGCRPSIPTSINDSCLIISFIYFAAAAAGSRSTSGQSGERPAAQKTSPSFREPKQRRTQTESGSEKFLCQITTYQLF